MAVEPSTAPVSEPFAPTQRLSILHGPRDPPLVDLSLGELLELQTYQHGTKECLVIPWTGARWTYNELNQQSLLLAQALLKMGIKAGDRVGVMAGNCEQYAAIFFAVSRIGAILVILNNTYTPSEAMYAVQFSGRSSWFYNQSPKLTVYQSVRFFSPPSGSADSTTQSSWTSWRTRSTAPRSS